MIIKGKNTKHFKDRDWDAYRNNSIGFVFQSYNLITHLSIVANVELSMTLSGVSSSEKRKRAIDVLTRVGLKDHLHKKPNQLSGGQMQRVAIARALVNNPEILLCDEPTGALDSATSEQIMDIIKEIAKDRLVIMVTHNAAIAEKYADRIIQFQDGRIISDSNPYDGGQKPEEFKLKKTSMSFFTALRLSFNNLKTKKGRTFITSFASSIGIIGIAVILSLSTGFQDEIDKFQQEAMAEFPIIITKEAMNLDRESITEARKEQLEDFPDSREVYLYDPDESRILHKNIFTDEFLDYLNDIDPEICGSIGYTYIVNMNLVRKVDDQVVPAKITSGITNMRSGSGAGIGSASSMQNAGLSSYPIHLNKNEDNFLKRHYQLLAGDYPESKTDMVLVVDRKNRISIEALKSLGFETDNIKSISFDEIIGTEFKLVSNNDYYVKTEFGSYLPGIDYQQMYDSENSVTLRIAGIVRQSPDSNLSFLSPGLAYSDELAQFIINNNLDSEIIKAQKEVDFNIITMEEISEDDKKELLAYLGGSAEPYAIMLYSNSFDDKEDVAGYLDAYNRNKDRKDQIHYTDLAKTITNMTSGIINGITLVLIAFAAISLVVSLIMIGIITYTSVLERTKEIGILRALGARKKDITRVFDAETCIIGVFSGILGIAAALLFIIPINSIIYIASGLKDVAHLQIRHAVILIIISTILTMLGGHIPAKMASRKDAVEALRSE